MIDFEKINQILQRPICQQILILIGYTISLIILRYVWKLCKGIWTCFLGYQLGFGVKWRPGYNVYAVITGASDGIGKEYAKQFAKIGYSLLLIARDEEKLKKLKAELLENYSHCKNIRILVVDFHSRKIYDKIKEELDSIADIDVLVNNVGALMSRRLEYFLRTKSSQLEEYINVNMMSYLKMTEMLLPRMVNKRRGIIINVSSFSGVKPTPFLVPYSATKAYIDFLSRGLSAEYASKGVIIQSVVPYYVETKLIKNFDFRYFQFTIIPVDIYIEACMKTVGVEWRTYGHWSHKIIGFLMEECSVIIGTRLYCKIAFLYQKTVYKWTCEKYIKSLVENNNNSNAINNNNNNNNNNDKYTGLSNV